MSGSKVVRRLGRTSMLTGAMLATGLTGTSLAGGANHIQVSRVPQHARVGVAYTVGIRGFAVRRERIYVFYDWNRCAANPAIEHSRAGGVWTYVQGTFDSDRNIGVKSLPPHRSGKKGVVHACAYLQSTSVALDSPKHVLARAGRSFRIH